MLLTKNKYGVKCIIQTPYWCKKEDKMTINNKKFDVVLAESGLTMAELAERAGLSRQRINIILNSKKATPQAVGKVARGLGVKVTEIID